MRFGSTRWYTRPRRLGEIFYLNASNQKIPDHIGWESKADLDEGLRRTIKIWKENQRI